MFVTQKITTLSITNMMKTGFVTHQKNVAVEVDFTKQIVRLVMELVVSVGQILFYFHNLCIIFKFGFNCCYKLIDSHIFLVIVRASGNGESNEKVAYFSNPSFPFKDNLTNYLTYTIKVCMKMIPDLDNTSAKSLFKSTSSYSSNCILSFRLRILMYAK